MDGDEGLSSLKAVPYLYTVFFFLLNLSTSFNFFFLNSPDRERFSSCCSRSANPEKLRSTIWNGPTCTSVHNTCARTHMCFRKKNEFIHDGEDGSKRKVPKPSSQAKNSNTVAFIECFTHNNLMNLKFGYVKELWILEDSKNAILYYLHFMLNLLVFIYITLTVKRDQQHPRFISSLTATRK